MVHSWWASPGTYIVQLLKVRSLTRPVWAPLHLWGNKWAYWSDTALSSLSWTGILEILPVNRREISFRFLTVTPNLIKTQTQSTERWGEMDSKVSFLHSLLKLYWLPSLSVSPSPIFPFLSPLLIFHCNHGLFAGSLAAGLSPAAVRVWACWVVKICLRLVCVYMQSYACKYWK